MDVQIPTQLQWLDENGMYRDPNDPMVYDLVTRNMLSTCLFYGYNGCHTNKLNTYLRKAGDLTLLMQSVTGELAYGGRSNQFLHNQTLFAGTCEWYASRSVKRGDMKSAMEFRRLAAEAVVALKRWLAQTPVSHVKNRYPRETGKGVYSDGVYNLFNKVKSVLGKFFNSEKN